MSSEPHAELAQVLPEVRRIHIQSKRLVTGVMAGGYRSVFRGSGIEFEEVREYVEGDDPRAVDWNVTARVGHPYVKTYIDERELTVLFLLDLSASMNSGLGDYSARQIAARVVACLALSAVKNNDKFGLIAFSEQVDRFVPPKKGQAHALRLIRDCLALPGGSPRTRLGPALEFAGRVARQHVILFLLSDFLQDCDERALRRTARRHDVVAVRLLPPELSLPDAGLLRVQDPESGQESWLDTGSPRVAAVYGRRVAEWNQRTIAALRRAGVDRVDVPVPAQRTRDPVVRPLLQFFRMRERRSVKR